MGVRIQELPETTGINKEDVLIVEDGQGTKKGTVQQLDETLGVSQLKEDLTNQFDVRFYADGTGENKCNPYTMTNGKVDIRTGFIDTTDTTCKTSDFIHIPDGETKVVASMGNSASISYQRISFYKSDKSFIRCRPSGIVAVDVPSEAKYVRVSNDIDKEHYVGFNSDGTYGGFVPYVVGKLYDDRLPNDVAKKQELELLEGEVKMLFPIQPENTTFFDFKKSSNHLTNNDTVVGRLQNGVVDTSQTNYKTYDYADIHGNAGKYLLFENGNGNIGSNAYAFYDVNKSYISGLNYSSNSALVIPNNAYYFRASASSSAGNMFVGINDDGSQMPYEEFYDFKYINPEYVKGIPSNWYKGKKGFGLGDSITANGSTYTASDGRTGSAWREFVATMLELSEPIYNCGVGGSKVSGVNESNPAMWTDERINAIPTDCDFGFFNGGMNDWGGNVQLGDEDSTDTNTFYGALNVIAKKLTQRFPTHPIFWMSTTYGYKGERPDGKNSIGLTQYDYGRAILKVAEKNGFIPIDLHALCGWNEYNVSQFVNDESTTEFAGFIHPNRNGGKKMATAICSVVKAYQPCELE
nr:MAG: GDSL-like Lipase/Acylhydrolase family protein [Bacteriophage sp.]